ncbi:MAG: exonuclease SbcCD subunit D [Lachnospiraceae bacterium]|nr:exonuclease SbcCD subunit D [Lachnospiraceae bacterium]
MKFFHLSDLHIGLKLINRDFSEDQAYILDQIIQLAGREKPDAVVIAGDLYDRAVPSAEAVELFDHFVSGLTEAVPYAEIMMISGNHDSAPRIDVFRRVLQHQHVHMIGIPPQKPGEKIEQVTMYDDYGPVHFYLLPYVRPSMIRQITGTKEDGTSLSYDEALHRLIDREGINQEDRNVLVSHQFYLPARKDAEQVERMDSEIRTVGNIDAVQADVLAPYDYAALGHIHKPMKVGSDVYRYCGTPLACSMSEAGQEKGIIEVTMEEKGTVHTRVLPLSPLRQVRILKGSLAEILEEACTDYVTVILTDPLEAGTMDTMDRLRFAFPNLLDVRRQAPDTDKTPERIRAERAMDPYELCLAFLGEVDEAQKELLQDVINQVSEVQS